MTRVYRLGIRSCVIGGLCLAAIAGCGSNSTVPGRAPSNHRTSDIQCTQSAPAGNCTCGDNCPTATYPGQWACTSDIGCGDGTNGRCVGNLGPAGCGCTYDSCTGDTDCPSGQTCACHASPYTYSAGNTCVPGNCRIDADCGTGAYCSPSPALPCDMTGLDYCQGVGYYCHTPKDQCIDDGDCAGSGCLYSPSDGYWKCHLYAQPL